MQTSSNDRKNLLKAACWIAFITTIEVSVRIGSVARDFELTWHESSLKALPYQMKFITY